MNRIFKVLWNKSRGCFVVSNEAQHIHGKEKSEKSSATSLGFAALLGLATFPSYADVTATEITKASDWSHTTITTTGNLTKIETSKIQGDTTNNKGIGINHFEKFNLKSGNIANLIVPGTANNLVNFVNQSVNIDGTVNSLKGSNVGGNLFFVTPNGMTIGATGVINAGSLTAVVPTQKAYNEWTGDISGKVTSELLNKMQSGAVALNPAGVITVNGNINTGNRIVLAASEVNVNAGAKLTNKRALTDFTSLVNIYDTDGNVLVSADVADGSLEARETTDKSGDILLLSRTDTTDQSTSVDIEAKTTVAGTIEGREDVAIGAVAGNGTYDPENGLYETSSLSTSASYHNVATIKSTVNISGSVSAADNLDVSAKAINVVEQGGLLNTTQDLGLKIFGAVTAVNEAVGFGNLTTKADVEIAKSATLTSGANLTIGATSETLLEVGVSFSAVRLLELWNKVEKKIPSVAAVVALADSSSSVKVEGSLTTGGNLSLTTKDKLTATADATASSAIASSQSEDPGKIGFLYGDFSGNSQVEVTDSAHLKLTGADGATKGGAVTIAATRTSRIDTSVDANAGPESYGALALNITRHNSTSGVTLNTGLEGLAADSLTIQSKNITERESVFTQTRSASGEGLLDKVAALVTGVAKNTVAGIMGRAAEGIDMSFTVENFKLGASVGVIWGTQTSSLTINAPNESLTSYGNVLIESLSDKFDHHYTLYAQSDGTSATEVEQHGVTKVAGSIGLLIEVPEGDDTVVSNLTIGDNVTIESQTGTLTVNNSAIIEYNRVQAMIDDILEDIEDLKEIWRENGGDLEDWKEVDEAAKSLEANSATTASKEELARQTTSLVSKIWTVCKNVPASIADAFSLVPSAWQFVQLDSYVNSYVAAAGSADSGEGAFGGGVGVLLQSTSSNLTIGKGAKLLVGTSSATTDAGWLTVAGKSVNESVALTGHFANYFGFALPSVVDSSSVGAFILVQGLETDNKVIIREGAILEDKTGKGAVKVTADDRIENITIGASGDASKGKIGVSANVVAGASTGKNSLNIDDETTVSGGSVTLQANRKDNNQAIVGTVSVGYGDEPSATVGASVAINVLDLKNKLNIEDNDILAKTGDTNKYTTIKGSITATSTDATNAWGVDISSRADTTVNAIGVAGAVSTSGTTPDDPEDENDNAEANILKRFYNWVKEKGTGIAGGAAAISQAINNKLNGFLQTAPAAANQVGKKIRTGIGNSFGHNANNNNYLNDQDADDDGIEMQELADGAENDAGEAQVGNADQINALDNNQPQARHFQLGLAASVAWNSLNVENEVNILADGFTITTPKANIEAVTDKWIGAWAGAAGVSYVKQQNAQTSSTAGAGGAIAVNSGTLTNKINIASAKTTVTDSDGLFLDGNVGSVTLRAVNDGTIVAEGLSAGIAAASSEDAGSQNSFDASVSVNMLTNTVRADVSNVTQKTGGTQNLTWDQAAWNGETQVTGGTGFGISVQKGDAAARSIGLLGAYAELNNTVASTFKNSKLLSANKFNLRALTSLTQVTTSVGANVTTGNTSTSFTGAVGVNTFDNTVSVNVENSTVDLLDGATTLLLAGSVTGDDSEEFTALSDWTPESKAADGIDDKLNNADFYKEVVFQTEKEQTKDKGKKLSDLATKTGLVQTTVVLSIAASIKDDAGGAAILVNKIDNDFTTTVTGSTIKEKSGTATTAGSYTQRAESNATTVAVASGIAAAPKGEASHYAVGGSVVVSNVDQNATSTVDASNITADSVTIEAGQKATTVNVAGEFGISLGGNGSGGGAAVLVMNTNNRAEVNIRKNATVNATVSDGALTVKALNKANSWGVSADVAITSKVSFAGSVVVNRVKNDALVTVDGLTLTDVTAASFNAEDESQLWTLAGSVGFGSANAGLTGAVGYSISGREGSDGTKVDVNNVTVQKHKAKTTLTDFTAKAEATDKLHTLVLAAGVSKGAGGVSAGFAGAAGVGEVKRTIKATVSNLKTETLSDEDSSVLTDSTATVLGALSVKAIETAGVNNLGIAGAFGDKFGLGIGIAINRITTTTEAALKRDALDSSRIRAETLEVTSKSSDEIENIAIGGSGSMGSAVDGSFILNKITNNTKTDVSNVKVDLTGAASIDAQSDDVIGSYAGQIAGAKTGAVGLSLAINERFGNTQTFVTSSEIKTTGTSTKTLTSKGKIDAEKINKKIVNDISIAASLEDDRQSQTIEGIRVGATSSTTFKNFVINGGASGKGAFTGSGTVTYHGGKTETALTSSTLEAKKDVSVESADWANVDNILTVAAFAGKGAGELAVNVATTEHDTSTTVEGGTLTSSAGAVKVLSEGKEGVSSLAIAVSGAQAGAGGVLVNVTRELSDVKTKISETTQATLTGKTVEAKSDYLGRLHSLAISANGAQGGAGNVNVIVNYNENTVLTSLGNSLIHAADSVTVSALRRMENSGIDIAASGAMYGGMAATVLVNTVEGSSKVTAGGAEIVGITTTTKSTDAEGNEVTTSTTTAPTITITSSGEDVFDLVGVTATGALYGSAGALVTVNRFLAKSEVEINASTIKGNSVTIKAEQNRDIDATNVFASLSIGTLGANVLATVVGEGGDPFGTATTKLTDLEEKVSNYTSEYGSASTEENKGILAKVVNGAGKNLTDAEKTEMLKAAATSAAGAAQKGGTHVKITGSTVEAETVSITAEEDTATWAHKDITVGDGGLGAGVFAASVATLREKRNLTTELAGSVITATDTGRIGTQIGGKTEIESYQAIVAGASAAASYVDIDVQGGSNVILNDVKLNSGDSGLITVSAEDASNAEAYSFGLTVALVEGSGVVANIDDASSVAVNISNQTTVAGRAKVTATRATNRSAKVKSGAGGILNGTGALATLTDTGNTTIAIDDLRSTGASLNVEALNKATLYTKAYQGYASALNVGVLHAYTTASGKTTVSMTGSALKSSIVFANAYTGSHDYDTNLKETGNDALSLTAEVDSYGCALVGGLVLNTAKITNETETILTVSGNTFDEGTYLGLENSAYGVYDAMSDLGTGGVISGGSSYAEVNHKSKLTSTVSAEDAKVLFFYFSSKNEESSKQHTYSAGGAAVEISPKAAHVVHNESATINSTFSGKWNAKNGAYFSNVSEVNATFLADNTKGVFAGGSSAQVDNEMTGTTILTIAGTWDVGGDITIASLDYIKLGAISGKTYAVDTAVYGPFPGTNGTINNTINRTGAVRIGDDTKLTSGGSLTIASQTSEDSTLRVHAKTGGAAAGVTAYNDNTITENTSILIGKNATLKNTDADKTVTIAASNSSKRTIEAIGDLEGAAFGGAGAKSRNNITENITVQTETGSKIEGEGKVAIYAGRNAAGDEADFDFTGYTHAYAHSVGGADTALKDTFNIKNQLTLNGDILAVRSIDLTADIGQWELSEVARFWQFFSSTDADLIRIASSGAGDKNTDGFTIVNSIAVNGNITAGTQTKSILNFSGIVDLGNTTFTGTGNDGSFEIEGATSEPTYTHEGVEGTVTYGVEDVANVYKERYEELQNLISDFSDSDTSVTAVLAYRQEMQLLRNKMKEQNLATFDDNGNILSIVSTDKRGYIKVSGVNVAGGDINFRTDSVTGTGTITANVADQITINNTSNLALTVENVRILEKGGSLTLNDLKVSNFEGFSGQVNSASTSADPKITITSRSANETLTGKTTKDGTVVEKTIKPDNTVTIKGVVANDAGALEVNVKGDLFVIGKRLAAATTMSLTATGSVMQSYTAGSKNIAGDIENLWTDEITAAKSETSTDETKGNIIGKGTSAKAPTTGEGSEGIIAGSDVFISADNINLNGYVQSGYSSWTLDISATELEAKVATIKQKWIQSGAKRDINPISDEFLIASGDKYKTTSGTYAMTISAWYDPVHDRVIVDDISPQGGHVYLTGRIASTGGGKIYAAAGTASVTIDSGTHSVRLGDISTKNGTGIIEITDTTSPGTTKSDTNADAVARVYRWENDGTTASFSQKVLYKDGTSKDATDLQDSDGNYLFAHATENSFAPTPGLSYIWSEGYRTGQIETKEKEQKFKWWDWFGAEKPDEWNVESEYSNPDPDTALGSATTLYVGMHKDNNYKFNAWRKDTTTQTGEWKVATWTTYDDFMHWHGTYHSKAQRNNTGTKVYTYSVKANESVDVGFVKGNNTVSVTSGADIVLAGQITAQSGTVTLKATDAIVNETSDALISGASNITLTAGGEIGEAEAPIRITNTSGALNLTATTTMSDAIHIDATGVSGGATVNAATLTAGSVNLTTRGDLNVTDLTAYQTTLVSSEGNIVVTNLIQGSEGEGDITRRFDATAAAGSVALTSAGDIGVGKIKARDAVTITSTGGTLWDAISREDLDNRNAEVKIQAWKEAGILASDGSNNGQTRYAEDVASQETIIRTEYERYADYAALTDKECEGLTDDQKSDYETLKTKYSSYATADAAIDAAKADSESSLSKTIAAQSNYGWDKNELLYAVSNAIVNPDSSATPSAGEPNIEANSISINVSKSAGKELEKQTIRFSELKATTEDGIAAYKTLARADVGDVKWDKENKLVEVTLKRPISVKLTSGTTSNPQADAGALTGKAGTGFYVASNEKLLVGEIAASAATVRLTSQKGIEALSGTTISATNLTLRGGTGTIGTSTIPMQINTSGWVALSAEEGIYIKELGEALTILSATTEKTLDIDSGKILFATETGQLAEGYISASKIVLHVNENTEIGSSTAALRIQSKESGKPEVVLVDSDGDSVTKVKTLYLDILGDSDSTIGVDANSTFEATNGLGITAEGNLTVNGSLISSKGSLELESAKTLTVSGATLTSDDIDLSAATTGSVVARGTTFNAATTGDSTVDITAKEDISLENATFSSDKVALTAKAAEGSVTLTRDPATTTDTFKSLKLTAGEDVNVAGNNLATTQSMTLDAEGTLNADDAVLTSKSTLTLSGNNAVNVEDTTLKADDLLTVTSEAGSVQAKDASIEAKGVIISAQRDVVLKEATIASSQGNVTITATKGKADLTVAADSTKTIAAKVLTVTAGTDVDLTNRTVTATDSLTLSASEDINAEDASLSAKGANITAAQDVSLGRATITSTDGDVSVTATGGSVDLTATDSTQSVTAKKLTVTAGVDVELTNRTVTATDSLTLSASEDINAEDASLSAKGASITATQDVYLGGATIDSAEGDVTVNATEGSVDLTATDSTQSVTAKKLTVTAGVDVELTNRTVTATDALTLSASEDINAENASLSAKGASITATQDVYLGGATIDSAEGDVTVNATEGSVDLTATDSTQSVMAKKLTVTAGTDVDLEGRTVDASDTLTLTASRNIEAESASLSAKGASITATQDVYLGGATITSTDGDVSVTATGGSVDLTATDSSQSITAQGLAVTAGTDVNLEGRTATTTDSAFTVKAEEGAINANDASLSAATNLALTSKTGITVGENASLNATEEVSLETASEDINISGNATISSKIVNLKATESEIFLLGKNSLTATQSAAFSSAGSVIQLTESTIETPELTAEATGGIYFASPSNVISKAQLDAGGDVTLWTTGADTTVTVNENTSYAGVVFGSLDLYGHGSGLTVTNDISAFGQVSLRASAIEAKDIVAFDGVYASTAYNGDTSTGLLKLGNVDSTEVGIMTENASIDVDHLASYMGSVCVYRTSLDTAGGIRIADGKAFGKGIVYNGNGSIYSKLGSDVFVRLIVGESGKIDRASLSSDGVVYMSYHMPYLSDQIQSKYFASADQIKWFPMLDLKAPSYPDFETAIYELRKVFSREKKRLTKMTLPKENVITDHWTESIEGREFDSSIFMF